MKTPPVTLKQVRALEGRARREWHEGYPAQNFLYDLEVRFGRLEQLVLTDPTSAFARRELRDLAGQVRWIRRSGAENRAYRAHVAKNRRHNYGI